MDALEEHYGQDALVERILRQLTNAGIDIDSLTPADLSGVDEFHLGGATATAALLGDLQLADDAKVIDIGSGIGGAARHMAAGSERHVTGIDLTPDFVELATELSARTGLASRTSFAVGDATNLTFDDDTFDAATMFHVGMNIVNKHALLTELARVVRPGGAVAVYDIMRIGDGVVEYPVPWSTSPTTSHLATPDDYRAAMAVAGLAADEPVDRRGLVGEALAATAANPPPVHLAHLMGRRWPEMFANLRTAVGDGVLAPIQIVAERGCRSTVSG